MAFSGDSNIENYIQSDLTVLLSTLSASLPAQTKWRSTILAHYSEPQRHYHTTSHIYCMLQLARQHSHLIRNPTAMKLAIYFHDIIYQPAAAHTLNELHSIDAFTSFADEVSLPPPIRAQVTLFIERTISHTLPAPADLDPDLDRDRDLDLDLALFLDFDLEVLSRAPAAYTAYAAQIRQEYVHVPDERYARERAKVLRGFLARKRLYFSELFFNAREGAARENLAGEIARLERGVGEGEGGGGGGGGGEKEGA